MSINDVVRTLGGQRTFGVARVSEHGLIEAIRVGLPAAALASVLHDFASSPCGLAEIFRAVGSERTLQRKRSDGTKLSPHESDRLARIARLVVRAEEVLGHRDSARRWLSEPNRALGNERPVALLDTDPGTRSVERVLGRIEHGIFS